MSYDGKIWLRVNVCKNGGRHGAQLSPMRLGPVDDVSAAPNSQVLALNIEDAWQGAKVFARDLAQESRSVAAACTAVERGGGTAGVGARRSSNAAMDTTETTTAVATDDDAGAVVNSDSLSAAFFERYRSVCLSGEAKRHREPYRGARPLCSFFQGACLTYKPARELMYARWYAALACATDAYADLRARRLAGENLLLLEYDGVPRGSALDADLDRELLTRLLDDESRPFGHGLVLAACLLDEQVWLPCVALLVDTATTSVSSAEVTAALDCWASAHDRSGRWPRCVLTLGNIDAVARACCGQEHAPHYIAFPPYAAAHVQMSPIECRNRTVAALCTHVVHLRETGGAPTSAANASFLALLDRGDIFEYTK